MTNHIFEIAPNPKAPGSYTHVDGYTLIDEGCSVLNPGEVFSEVADSLRTAYGADAKFALVELDDEDSPYSVIVAES